MKKPITPEASWQRTIREAAGYAGWYCLHFPNAMINPPGFPDLLCFRGKAECPETLLLELKNEIGKLGPKQIEMHATLAHYGHTVHVLRPQDNWDDILGLLRKGKL